ncbi:hypothetical protein AA313_de0203151 [Arthrobotrys entomopaga]|nr:hypothetical protein AA313_de0203151 [Arthrobotrys entomopaga]
MEPAQSNSLPKKLGDSITVPDIISRPASGMSISQPEAPTCSCPTFATPIPQSSRSQTLQWTLPRPFQQHKLIGRSRAAWHTSFLLPSLNAVLDAGVIIDDSRPQNVFITHGHSDHSYNVLVYCRRMAPPDIYIPAETAKFLDNYIVSSKSLNLNLSLGSYHKFDDQGIGHAYQTVDGRLVPRSAPISRSMTPSPNPSSSNQSLTPSNHPPAIAFSSNKSSNLPSEELYYEEEEDPEDVILPTHNIIPVTTTSSETFTLKTHPTITVSILPRNHTVPSVGYLFTQTSSRLKATYKSLPGPELKKLREQGVEITYKHRTPILAFLGDGDHTSLLNDPEWLVGNPEGGVSHCPVVVTECSFLYEAHRAQAEKTKHTLWDDLEPIVRRHPGTTFVLMHFSRRYADAEIVAFFEDLGKREEGCPGNIVVWVDGGNEIVEAKVRSRMKY